MEPDTEDLYAQLRALIADWGHAMVMAALVNLQHDG
jgi:hypothetical protein